MTNNDLVSIFYRFFVSIQYFVATYVAGFVFNLIHPYIIATDMYLKYNIYPYNYNEGLFLCFCPFCFIPRKNEQKNVSYDLFINLVNLFIVILFPMQVCSCRIEKIFNSIEVPVSKHVTLYPKFL